MIYNTLFFACVILLVILILNLGTSIYQMYHDYHVNYNKVIEHIEHSKDYTKRIHCQLGEMRYKDMKYGYTDCERADENSKKDPIITARWKTWIKSPIYDKINIINSYIGELFIFSKYFIGIIIALLIAIALKWIFAIIDSHHMQNIMLKREMFKNKEY